MSDFTNRIDTLLTQTHQRRADLSRGTGLPESTIRGWIKEDKIPNLEAVIKIANFFGCSIEYLATGNEETKPEMLSDDEQDLVNYFRMLDDRDRDFLLLTARSLCSRAKEEKRQDSSISKIG